VPLPPPPLPLTLLLLQHCDALFTPIVDDDTSWFATQVRLLLVLLLVLLMMLMLVLALLLLLLLLTSWFATQTNMGSDTISAYGAAAWQDYWSRGWCRIETFFAAGTS